VLLAQWWTPLRADIALTVALFAVESLMWLANWYAPSDRWLPFWIALTLAPIALRRRWLWGAIVITFVFMMFGVANGSLWAAQGIALWVLAYTVAAYETWWRAATASLVLWAANDLAYVVAIKRGYLDEHLTGPMISLQSGLVANLVLMVILFLIGRTIRARREVQQALRDRAAAAEQGRHAHAEQAVAEERRRIARELHDVVAHHVSVISVMATGARRVLKHDYAAAEQALTTIEQTSRTTLRELRRLLFLLRIEAETESQLSPQPGLDGIRTLVEQVREAGLPANLRVTGDPDSLDPGVALTGYRIVQEALTNALKHAGQATAEVRLDFTPGVFTIEVFDTGVGPSAASGQGHGLLGMRERVAVYGGTLRTGPRPGGGFRVYAKIPVESSQAEVEAVA
jgi:signal transduction histidine kinase